MKGKSELARRTTNTYFAKRFSELIEEWKTKTGGTQEQFATACLSNKNSIGNYKKGKSIPTDATINEMITVFNDAGMNVKIEDFMLPAYTGLSLNDPSRVKMIQDHSREVAEKIGLSEDFLRFLSDNTSFHDIKDGYCVWTPLCREFGGKNDSIEFNGRAKGLEKLKGHKIIRYGRRFKLRTHLPLDDQSFTLNATENTNIFLSETDMYILKEMQDQIVEMIEYLYFAHRRKLENQVTKAILRANQFDEKGNLKSAPLSNDDLIAIDPYMKRYLEKE